jgi:hypothetical protein
MLKRLKKRVEAGALVTALVVPLSLCVFAFLSVACFFALRQSLSPALAALVTAAAGIVSIALVLLVARIASALSGPTARRESAPADLGDDFESFLREHADPALAGWVRRNPDRAAVVTLILGMGAGYSDRFRRTLLDLYARYAESEAVRRERRRR